jgi:hypothetical protein
MGIREITHQLIPTAPLSPKEERVEERDKGRNGGRGIPSMQHLQKMEKERAYERERGGGKRREASLTGTGRDELRLEWKGRG